MTGRFSRTGIEHTWLIVRFREAEPTVCPAAMGAKRTTDFWPEAERRLRASEAKKRTSVRRQRL
jgi:hypothetical protein